MTGTSTDPEKKRVTPRLAAVSRQAHTALRRTEASPTRVATHPDPRAARMERRYQVPTIVAAILVVPVVLTEQDQPSPTLSALAAICDWVIWGTFLAELLSVMAVSKRRSQWLRDHPLELAIILLTPPFAPLALQSVRAFRLLRLMRLVVTVKRLKSFDAVAGLKYAAIVSLFGVVISGASFATVEKNQHLSTWDGIWWALSTVSTVGYGDIVPKTDEGRVIAIVVMFIGVGFVATLTSSLVHFFQSRFAHEVDVADQRADLRHADVTDQLAGLGARLAELEAMLAERLPTPASPPRGD